VVEAGDDEHQPLLGGAVQALRDLAAHPHLLVLEGVHRGLAGHRRARRRAGLRPDALLGVQCDDGEAAGDPRHRHAGTQLEQPGAEGLAGEDAGRPLGAEACHGAGEAGDDDVPELADEAAVPVDADRDERTGDDPGLDDVRRQPPHRRDPRGAVADDVEHPRGLHRRRDRGDQHDRADGHHHRQEVDPHRTAVVVGPRAGSRPAHAPLPSRRSRRDLGRP
jgi:hypothetical protein